MKKIVIFGLLLLVGMNGWGQMRKKKDTLKYRVVTDNTTQYDIAKRLFGRLQHYVPTHKLFNQLMLNDTLKSVVWNTDSIRNNKKYGATADHVYNFLYEIRLMSFDTSTVPESAEIMRNAMDYMARFDFEEGECHYPIAIFDYKYNVLDIEKNKKEGNITMKDSVYIPTSSRLDLGKRRAAFIGPLFDLYGSQRMGIVFRKENFYSNYRKVSNIQSILLIHNGEKRNLNFGETYYFQPKLTSSQKFKVIVRYKDGTKLSNFFTIHTPYLVLKRNNQGKQIEPQFAKKDSKFCIQDGEITKDIASGTRKLKLKWCLQPRCGWNGRIYKPYILVTGYRPPYFGQKFSKTWQYYNDEHGNLLSDLRNNNYDIFLVKFNMQWRYFKMGMMEASKLLERFIIWVNQKKGGQTSGQENVIQGSSMGASVVRLTLLRMEKKHFEDNSYPNHHTRLFISYDANYYGANIPLSYQAQIYSAYHHPGFGPFAGPFPGIRGFLRNYLYLTLNQTATQQLLTYHINAYNPFIFTSNYENYTYYKPTYSPLRGLYLHQLDEANNHYASIDGHTNFIPMPNATRNIAISLGHYNLPNSENPDVQDKFLNSGDYWRDINLWLWQYELGVAKYMSPGNTFRLFRRRKAGIFGFLSVNHELHVSQMREVDNPSGSYLDGFGNIITVSDWTYFFWLAGGYDLFHWTVKPKYFFTHKSVITALAINKNIWPSDGSMTLDLQNMDLMYNSFTGLQNQDPSKYYGYPNLGRPNDHFNITPFEAIFCGPKIQPHIRLKDASSTYINKLDNFIKNEVEPWYLALQNTHLGAQARSNYRYYSFRRARNRIIIGANVTPKTDQGDYVVEPNGKLTLHAGDEIVLKPGTHFKAGSIVHIVPEYNRCGNTMFMQSNNSGENNDGNSNVTPYDINATSTIKKQQGFKLFPNPTHHSVTIEAKQDIVPQKIEFYNLQGGILLQITPKRFTTTVDVSRFHKGLFLVRIITKNKVFNYKIVVK